MLKILGRKTYGNTQKVLWCCDELGLAYEREDLGRGFGNNYETAYLALNPNGGVPTMVDDGFVLWESNAIVRYLCAKHGMGTLCPPELQRRADMERWMDWQQTLRAPGVSPQCLRSRVINPPDPSSLAPTLPGCDSFPPQQQGSARIRDRTHYQ